MNETIVYVFCGLIVYFTVYLMVRFAWELLFKPWCAYKAKTEFYENTIANGLWMYYRRFYDLIVNHNVLTRIVTVIFWPIAMPMVAIIMTKAITKVQRNQYQY